MPDWFLEWVERHRKLFLLPAEWPETAVMWWPELFEMQPTAEELAAATREVQHKPPRWPSEHMPAVRSALGWLRDCKRKRDEEQRASAYEDRVGVCTLCGECSWVIVPYHADVRDGEWLPGYHAASGAPIYRTSAVSCKCPRGRAGLESAVTRGKRCLSLEDYELTVCADWPALMAKREAAERRRYRFDKSERGWSLDRVLRSIGVKV